MVYECTLAVISIKENQKIFETAFSIHSIKEYETHFKKIANDDNDCFKFQYRVYNTKDDYEVCKEYTVDKNTIID